MHTALTTYSPSGSPLWSFPTPYPYNVFTQPDVGSDGVHYFVQNLIQLFALNTGGSQRWHLTLTDYVAGPIVDPLNTQLVMGSADTLDHAGFIVSKSAKDGSELWRVTLPIEDGFNQFVDTRARFALDGLTAYLVTATATGDNSTSRSFVYSLNASVDPPPPASTLLHSPSITLSANLLKKGRVSVIGLVAVKDQNDASITGATVAASWTLPNGSTQNQTATTDSNGNASFSTKSGRGTYTLTITNIAKTGCTFDKANSILTKSITK